MLISRTKIKSCTIFIAWELRAIYCSSRGNASFSKGYPACRRFEGVFIAAKPRKTRSSRLPALSWTRAKIGRKKTSPARNPVSRELQILTSSAGRRGVLIGRFAVNHRQFGATQRRDKVMSKEQSSER